MTVLLVANRGEIAVRIIRSARALGITAVAVHASDDAAGLHVALADEAIELPGSGPAAYLDIDAVIAAARDAGAELIHPGYGFLAESAAFAHACHEAEIGFLGPSPEALDVAGEKTATKERARSLGIPVAEATEVLDSAGPAAALLERHPAGIAIKALAGGGGRGIAVVTDPDELESAIVRCSTEALHGFGDGRVFAESWLTGARHIEVQCIGTPDGVTVLGDRDCSVQRRRQKIVEIAPAPGLSDEVRTQLWDAAARILDSMHYISLATVEFLVAPAGESWVLMEINPRIQVEHTVTEAVTGIDLAAAQIALGLGREPELTPAGGAGCAIQARVCAETVAADGAVAPSAGRVTGFGVPAGPGVRVDTWVRTGVEVSGRYDTLLAKIITDGPDPAAAVRRLDAALAELELEGPETNTGFLRAVLDRFEPGGVDTGWLDRMTHEIVAAIPAPAEAVSGGAVPGGAGTGASPVGASPIGASPVGASPAGASGPDIAGPGSGHASGAAHTPVPALGPGEEYVRAPLSGTIVALAAPAGAPAAGSDAASAPASADAPTDGPPAATVTGPGELGLIEAMKMHHVIPAPAHSGAVPLVEVGQTVTAGEPLFIITVAASGAHGGDAIVQEPHPGVAEVGDRHAAVLDDAKPDAVARIHGRGRRTARENLDDLIVEGTFVEYGPLVIAAQRARRTLEDLIARTSGDGLVGGIGFVDTPSGPVEVVAMSYDYMVLAGTQGSRNHDKTDRLIQLAGAKGLPVILFAEGGGGRPGDTDRAPGAHLKVHTFAALAGLKGRVPLVAIASGRCFAGNAALAGVCDVIIATPDVNLGMGGPAMVEGGGLGRRAPEDIGPAAVHTATGVIDLLVDDDAAAVAATREVLGHLAGRGGPAEAAGPSGIDSSVDDQSGAASSSAASSGAASSGDLAPDPDAARAAVPGDRLRAFDMRAAIAAVVDSGSLVELRPEYAPGAITGFGRVDGRTVAIIANDNHHLGGAIDVDAARSFVEHLELAEAHRIPIVSFVDTPGFMVGPEAEHEPGVKAFGRFFTAGAGLTVPCGAIIVRKGYGLGAMAMTAGSFAATRFTVAWPSGEIGPMGLEGAVRLGFAKELAAIADPVERESRYAELVAESYEQGRAMTAAMLFDVDDVIDPAWSRRWIGTLF